MVYIVRLEGTNFVKIGSTNGSVKKRVMALQRSVPGKLVLEKVLESGGAALERELQQRFAGSWSGGGREWFNLTDEEVEWLRALEDEADERRLPSSASAIIVNEERLRELFRERGLERIADVIDEARRQGFSLSLGTLYAILGSGNYMTASLEKLARVLDCDIRDFVTFGTKPVAGENDTAS
jgi:hypothetical protein